MVLMEPKDVVVLLRIQPRLAIHPMMAVTWPV